MNTLIVLSVQVLARAEGNLFQHLSQNEIVEEIKRILGEEQDLGILCLDDSRATQEMAALLAGRLHVGDDCVCQYNQSRRAPSGFRSRIFSMKQIYSLGDKFDNLLVVCDLDAADEIYEVLSWSVLPKPDLNAWTMHGLVYNCQNQKFRFMLPVPKPIPYSGIHILVREAEESNSHTLQVEGRAFNISVEKYDPKACKDKGVIVTVTDYLTEEKVDEFNLIPANSRRSSPLAKPKSSQLSNVAFITMNNVPIEIRDDDQNSQIFLRRLPLVLEASKRESWIGVIHNKKVSVRYFPRRDKFIGLVRFTQTIEDGFGNGVIFFVSPDKPISFDLDYEKGFVWVSACGFSFQANVSQHHRVRVGTEEISFYIELHKKTRTARLMIHRVVLEGDGVCFAGMQFEVTSMDSKTVEFTEILPVKKRSRKKTTA